jgi:hypothetical protein
MNFKFLVEYIEYKIKVKVALNRPRRSRGRIEAVAYPGIFLGGSTNSVEDREQRERGSGGGSPLVWVSTQFEND